MTLAVLLDVTVVRGLLLPADDVPARPLELVAWRLTGVKLDEWFSRPDVKQVFGRATERQ